MTLEQKTREVLSFLFEGYKKDGGGYIYPITEVAERLNLDPHEFGSFLLNRGLIKEQRFMPDSFECSISISGILAIAPDYFADNVSKVLSTLGVTGNGWTGLTEILDFEPSHQSRVRDIATVLDNQGYVELQYQAEDVYAKLNIVGKDFYERNKAKFQ